MGRELRRVPLDFDWPIDVIWKGYLNPYSPTECELCDGSGMNPAMKKLSDDWYTHNRTDGQEGWMYHLDQEDVDALVEAGRLWQFTRKDRPKPLSTTDMNVGSLSHNSVDNLSHNSENKITADEVNEWARKCFGHDGINQGICVVARAKRLGIYGMCPLCRGKGHYWCEDKYEKLYEDWESIEPPTGEGFQLWETTSEGSPTSPVFKTLDELCEWCEKNATTFAHFKASKSEWLKMLSEDDVHHQEGCNIFF